MPFNYAPEIILADASLSTGGYGKIAAVTGTSGTLLVRLDNTVNRCSQVDWRIRSNQTYCLQLMRGRAIPTATITLTDATAVDADDTFVLNGNTYTYKAGANVLASRYIGLGADNAAAATNTATMLSDQTYGIIGATAASAAVDATDVITITPTATTCLQFGQGTSAANEVAWSGQALTGLSLDGSAKTTEAANSSYAGKLYTQWLDGWDYGYAYIYTTGGDATMTIAATKYN